MKAMNWNSNIYLKSSLPHFLPTSGTGTPCNFLEKYEPTYAFVVHARTRICVNALRAHPCRQLAQFYLCALHAQFSHFLRVFWVFFPCAITAVYPNLISETAPIFRKPGWCPDVQKPSHTFVTDEHKLAWIHLTHLSWGILHVSEARERFLQCICIHLIIYLYNRKLSFFCETWISGNPRDIFST